MHAAVCVEPCEINPLAGSYHWQDHRINIYDTPWNLLNYFFRIWSWSAKFEPDTHDAASLAKLLPSPSPSSDWVSIFLESTSPPGHRYRYSRMSYCKSFTSHAMCSLTSTRAKENDFIRFHLIWCMQTGLDAISEVIVKKTKIRVERCPIRLAAPADSGVQLIFLLVLTRK